MPGYEGQDYHVHTTFDAMRDCTSVIFHQTFLIYCKQRLAFCRINNPDRLWSGTCVLCVFL